MGHADLARDLRGDHPLFGQVRAAFDAPPSQNHTAADLVWASALVATGFTLTRGSCVGVVPTPASPVGSGSRLFREAL